VLKDLPHQLRADEMGRAWCMHGREGMSWLKKTSKETVWKSQA